MEKSRSRYYCFKWWVFSFSEVKTRASEKFGPPEQAITPKKESLYKDAVEDYLEQYPSNLEIRFDVISIIISKEQTKIEHFPNAFWVSLQKFSAWKEKVNPKEILTKFQTDNIRSEQGKMPKNREVKIWLDWINLLTM